MRWPLQKDGTPCAKAQRPQRNELNWVDHQVLNQWNLTLAQFISLTLTLQTHPYLHLFLRNKNVFSLLRHQFQAVRSKVLPGKKTIMRHQTELFVDTHKAPWRAMFLNGTITHLFSLLSNSHPFQRLSLPTSHRRTSLWGPVVNSEVANGTRDKVGTWTLSLFLWSALSGQCTRKPGEMVRSAPHPPNPTFLTFSETETAAISSCLPFSPFLMNRKTNFMCGVAIWSAQGPYLPPGFEGKCR